jgi:hypothetical protein
MHSAQTSASSEVKGVAQMRQQGPPYFSMPDQQTEQKGAIVKVSVSFPQEGHSEG